MAVPVWVKLPYLSSHCWNDAPSRVIKNSIGKYIDCAEPKEGLFACAWICVEVDHEKCLPASIKLSMDDLTHIQEVDYDQLPFKC